MTSLKGYGSFDFQEQNPEIQTLPYIRETAVRWLDCRSHPLFILMLLKGGTFNNKKCNSLPVVHLRQLYNKVEYQLSWCPTTSDNFSCDVQSRASQEETVRNLIRLRALLSVNEAAV